MLIVEICMKFMLELLTEVSLSKCCVHEYHPCKEEERECYWFVPANHSFFIRHMDVTQSLDLNYSQLQTHMLSPNQLLTNT